MIDTFRQVRGAAVALAAAFAAFYCSKLAMAEPSDTTGSLEDVTVTSTRTAQPVANALASVTVLTQQDIQSRQVLSLQDLFVGEAGMQISNNGGLGKATSVFLRGANADQVLVLVDGVRMGSATLGTTAFQYVPVDQIERVEIVRGPLSSLYGSEAIGGVIQIFTKRPTSDGVALDADASAGSHDTYNIGADFNVLSGRWSFGVSANNLTSSGFPNCSGVAPSATSFGAGCFADDPRRDGFHTVSDSAHLGYQFSDDAGVEATLLRAQGGTRYAGDYTNHEDFVEQAASVAGHWSPLAGLRLTARVGQSRDNELDTLDFVEPPGNLFDTLRNSASVQADWTFMPQQILTLGGDFLRDNIVSDAGFPVTSRHVSGEFAEYQGTFGPQQIALSGRHDDNSQFGDKNTGNAEWGYRITPNWRVVASYGSAFHAPSFDDLYFPFFGNPLLKPETSHSYEVGVEQRVTAFNWSLHGFDTEVHNLISYDAVLFAPENTDRARLRGAELQGGTTSGPWILGLTGTWLDARDRTIGSVDYGLELPRRARGTGRLEFAHAWQNVRATARINIAGPSFDDLANTASLGGYTTADALVEWAPLQQWTLQAKVANLAGHRYQTAQYYPQDGRNFLVTLRYRPLVRTVGP